MRIPSPRLSAWLWLLLIGCAGSSKARPDPTPVTKVEEKAVIRPPRQPFQVGLATFRGVGNVLHGLEEAEGRMYFWSNGKADAPIRVPAGGEYVLVVTASCQAALDEFARFRVYLDDAPVGAEVALVAEEPREYRLPVRMEPGERKLTVQFTNDAYKENEYDRNLYIHGVRVDVK